MYRIIIADDHVILRHGIRSIIEGCDDLQVVGDTGDGVELLKLVSRQSPDLVLLDITMPRLRGIEAAIEIKMIYPEIKILILTMHNSMQYLHHALSAGVDGYLLKQDAPREIFSAIQIIREGKIYVSPHLSDRLTKEMAQAYRTGKYNIEHEPLTLREREVLTLIAEEKTNGEIGDLLAISLRTVQHHRAAIKRKLNIRKTAGLVKYAIRKGYTTSDT